ncbi:MAG TPA: GAF domain-containing protein, partial [Candidatus Limnocylindria bacterium]|nr:GAF domain-containing protein [Candidatus Limnocylindria bacterium]
MSRFSVPGAPPGDALLTVSQAATRLGVHPNTVRAWTAAGRLTAYRINDRGDRRYRASELHRLLERSAPGPRLSGVVRAHEASGQPPGAADALARVQGELIRARALREVIAEMSATLDLGTVLEEVVERTRTLFGADKAGLWLLGDERHPFGAMAAGHGISAAFRAAVAKLSMDSDTIGVRALRERRPRWIRNADLVQGAGLLRETYAAEGIRTVCLVPLVVHDQPVGLLGLYHATDRSWPAEEVGLVQAFANQAAVSIQNARLYRSLAEQAARMRSIQDLSARLNRLTDVRAIAEAIVSEARTLAEYHDIRVYTVDWETRMCEPIAYTDRLLGVGDFRERLRVPVGPGSFTGTVADTAEPMLLNDALHDPRGMTIDGTDDIEESMLIVPMVYEGRAVGVIALSKLGLNQFSADDLQTMTIFAGYAAQAVANAAAYAQLERQSAELSRRLDLQRQLLAINEQLLSTLSPTEVLERIADGLFRVVNYDNLSIFRADHERRVLVPVLARERYAEEVLRHVAPFGHGLMGWAVHHAEPLLVNEALADPRAIQIPDTPEEPEAIIVVPLVAGGHVIGALNVGRVGGPEVAFSDADFELVQLFAAQAAIALRTADEHQAVRLRAETDALTGLGNHGAFQRDLQRTLETTRGAGADRRVALLMMDLDRFKAYNDRHGHPAGDALLTAVARAIESAARRADRVY